MNVVRRSAIARPADPRRWRTGRVLVAAVLVLGWLAPAAAPAAAMSPVRAVAQEDSTLTWSVRPTPTEEEPERPHFSYDVDPGQRIEDSLRVRNFDEEPLSLSVYASDALTTSSGALDLLPAGEQPTGVGAWIVPDVAAVEVPPQDHVDVPFTMVVPGNTESGDHTGGIVTSFRAPGTDAEGRAVVVDRRLGSRVHVRVGGELHPRLEVTDLTVEYAGTANPLGTGDLRVTYTVTNTGNVRLAATQLVSVPGRLGLPGREATLDPMPELLPSHSLTFSADIPDVWPTVRTAATVAVRPVPTRDDDEFGPDTPSAGATASTWSVPWTSVLVLLAVAGVVLGGWWMRRRHRRREAALRQQAVQTAAIVRETVQAVLAAREAGEPDRAAAEGEPRDDQGPAPPGGRS